MLLISVAIFFGYVWPEINDARQMNSDYLDQSKQLSDMNDKQKAINDVADQIKQDPTTTQAITDYLPPKKSEEQVINNVNFIATSSSVNLVNLSISDVAADATAASDPSAAQPQVDQSNPVSFTEATISAVGSYDNLGIFLSGLQHSGMYNQVKSVTIKFDDTDPQSLDANVVMDFGYMPPVKFSPQMLGKLSSSLDSDSVSSLQKYVSNKAQNIDIGSTGKSNPFQF